MASRPYDLLVAGAGMGGLVAAAHATSRGASVLVREKGDRPGGSMALSSGVIWRHREFEDFRAECPDGDPKLQGLVYERLDADLAWLESLGAPVVRRGTGNPRTRGLRFDPGGLTTALAAHAGTIELGRALEHLPDDGPVILATGGFQGDRALVRQLITPEADSLLLRANPWSSGDGLRLGLERGAPLSGGLNEFYGRNLPAPPALVGPDEFVSAAQLYAHHATVTNLRGDSYAARTWSEIDVVQWTARQPSARARYAVAPEALATRVGERTVSEMIDSARSTGARIERRGESLIVEVVAAITTTLGGLGIDERAQSADGVFACGADVGGICTGGYASGLAAALVFGRIAAESALGSA
jgi:succinate dehydrogenase/fumarate reductase flavoprotein subunit